jgi:sporulation protein YlmC with PRC-barrel domain
MAAVPCLAQRGEKATERASQRAVQQDMQLLKQALGDQQVELERAISAAENKTGGTAISARCIAVEAQDWTGQRKAARQGQQRMRCEVFCLTKDDKIKAVTVDPNNYKVRNVRPVARIGRAADAPGQTGNVVVAAGEYSVFRVLRATNLMGAEVRNYAGQELGEIENFALHPRSGEILYAVLSFDQFWDDKLFAVPLSGLEFISDELVLSTITEQELEAAPGFDDDNWPSTANLAWATDTSIYGDPARADRIRYQQRQRDVTPVKATTLIGAEVINKRDEDLGDISDLVIDPDRARIAYVTIEHGDLIDINNDLEFGDDIVAAPWAALSLRERGEEVVLPMRRESLEDAPRFATEEWSGVLAQPDFVMYVYRYYQAQPYWKNTDMTKRTRGQQSRMRGQDMRKARGGNN